LLLLPLDEPLDEMVDEPLDEVCIMAVMDNGRWPGPER
jgi:hypothetical protein